MLSKQRTCWGQPRAAQRTETLPCLPGAASPGKLTHQENCSWDKGPPWAGNILGTWGLSCQLQDSEPMLPGA